MKKILFAVFALAALASCTNNEVIELNQQAIAFGDVFVDNATRADYSQAGKLVGSFKVYGTANDVLIYNGITNIWNNSNFYACRARSSASRNCRFCDLCS